MPKQSKQVIIDAIIKEIEQGSIEWLSEYLKSGSIYDITPPDCANRVNVYGYYVYALIDPFNGKIFYIGKGKGKRAYNHFLEQNKDNTAKKDKIAEIYSNGDKAIVWILEHNMSEKSALDLECLLINTVPGLTNKTIPKLKECNKWLASNKAREILGMVPAECIEVDMEECPQMSKNELLDLMAVVVCNGCRSDKSEHKYILNGRFYDFSSTIHLLPARLRDSKGLSISEYINRKMRDA